MPTDWLSRPDSASNLTALFLVSTIPLYPESPRGCRIPAEWAELALFTCRLTYVHSAGRTDALKSKHEARAWTLLWAFRAVDPRAWTLLWAFRAVDPCTAGDRFKHSCVLWPCRSYRIILKATEKLLPCGWNLTYLWSNTYWLVCSSNTQIQLLYEAQNEIGYGSSVDSKLNRRGYYFFAPWMRFPLVSDFFFFFFWGGDGLLIAVDFPLSYVLVQIQQCLPSVGCQDSSPL